MTTSSTASRSQPYQGVFPRGASGNAGGRPRGLARKTRELVGDDGDKIARFWFTLMQDETEKMTDRLKVDQGFVDSQCRPYGVVHRSDRLGRAAIRTPRR